MTAALTDEQLDWVAKFTNTPRAALAQAKGADADEGDGGKSGKGGNGAAAPNGADADTPQRAKYSPPAQSRQPTLRKGDESPDGWVEYLQELLKVTVTGKFDGATEKAVKAFQGSHGCMVDGVVGNETWSMLRHEKKEAVGTDGRDPHSFEQAGVQARFFLEDKFVVYDKGADSVSFIIESVGDQTDISRNKATFRITPPGGSGQAVELTIGAPTKKSPDGQGNQHTVTIAKLKATYPAEGGAQGNYKIEGYLESAIGGDRWSGDVLDKAPAPPPQPKKKGGGTITLPEITIIGTIEPHTPEADTLVKILSDMVGLAQQLRSELEGLAWAVGKGALVSSLSCIPEKLGAGAALAKVTADVIQISGLLAADAAGATEGVTEVVTIPATIAKVASFMASLAGAITAVTKLVECLQKAADDPAAQQAAAEISGHIGKISGLRGPVENDLGRLRKLIGI
jgi:hypothetical protein